MKTETVRARVEPSLKYEVETVLDHLGLTMSEAIELYLCQIKLQKGIPFDIRIPTDLTLETFNKTDRKEELNQHDDLDNMFNHLGI